MSRRGITLALTSLLALSAFPMLAQRNQPTQAQRQAAQREQEGNALKKWPQEEVSYIIDGEEEAAFNRLKTDEERALFIEQFWLRRDTTPDTSDNEYRDDYYRRIAQANEKFSSGIPGWKTDRGRIFVTYGEPDEVQTQAMGGTYYRPIEEGGGVTSTFPFEKWRYRHIDGIGPNIELEFVDSSMSGEYRLTFDPSEKDALLNVPGVGLTDFEIANGLDKADRLKRDHAVFGNPLGQDTRMSQFDRLQLAYDIMKPPPVKFKDLEAIVSSRISYNVLPFDYRADFLNLTDTAVLTPITLQIPYKSLAFREEEGFHKASMRISAHISDLVGNVKYRFEDATELPILSAQFRSDGVAAYQKVLNIAPGNYKLFILVEDSRTGNKGTVQRALQVRRFPDGNLSASSLILADLVEPLPPRTVAAQYQIGNTKVRPSVKNEFRRDQTMNVFLQIYSLKIDDMTHKPSVSTEVLITRDGQQVKKPVDEATEIANAARQMNFVKKIPMNEFEPGTYKIQIKVKDVLANELIEVPGTFTVR
jgi:GWxTD domain-containing protein